MVAILIRFDTVDELEVRIICMSGQNWAKTGQTIFFFWNRKLQVSYAFFQGTVFSDFFFRSFQKELILIELIKRKIQKFAKKEKKSAFLAVEQH